MSAASPMPAAPGARRPAAARGRPRLVDEASRAAMLTALRVTVRTGLAGVWVRGRLPGGLVLLADPANVRQYRFARRIGVVGTDELRTALAAVRGGAVLVVYPEGRLLTSGPPAPLARGAAWSAAQGPARLCSAAVRVLHSGVPRVSVTNSCGSLVWSMIPNASSPMGQTER